MRTGIPATYRDRTYSFDAHTHTESKLTVTKWKPVAINYKAMAFYSTPFQLCRAHRRSLLSISLQILNQNMAYAQKHLTTGDSFPQLPADDKLILLSMRFCPYAQRVHLVLDAKNIDHHVVNIHLKQKPEWLTDYSRLGKVPALGLTNESGKPYLHESLVIADYLDEKYAHVRPLYPTDPLAKALDRLWIERFGGIVSAYYRIAFSGAEVNPADVEQVAAGLDTFEAELKRRDQRFFGDAALPGMLDYMIWPWFERFDAQKFKEGVKLDFGDSRYPLLVRYFKEMQQDEAVKKTFLSGDVHFKFMQGHFSGTPNYELLASL